MEQENKVEGVGFILDGNRRWARGKGLTTLAGHAQGLKGWEDIIMSAHKIGIPHIVGYLFSTENWNRSKEEVDYLMTLFRETLDSL